MTIISWIVVIALIALLVWLLRPRYITVNGDVSQVKPGDIFHLRTKVNEPAEQVEVVRVVNATTVQVREATITPSDIDLHNTP